MELFFKKIAKDGSDFSLLSDKVSFGGKVFLKSPNMAFLKALIKGEVRHICDRCGEDINLEINEPLEIMISDGVYSGEIDELDVVEIYDGLINFDEILQSEIESFKSDYHYCDACKN